MAARKRSSAGGGRQKQSKRVASRAERTAPVAERRHDIPEVMRAAAIDRFGGPEVLTLHRLPVPVTEANEVLIAVATAGVGGWDAEMRAGWWPSGRPRFPLVLGSDGAGIVAAAGARVRRFKPGDRVYGYSFANPKGGFYAEFVAVAVDGVAPIPAGLDLEHAGAVPVIGLTALQGIDEALRVKRGEAIIVHGASGGVGHLALQFAKFRGARVLATATGDDGVAFVRRLGADDAVDGKKDDIAAAARAFAPDGVDAVLALAGGPALTQCLDALRRGGRVAYPNGVEPKPRKRRGVEVTAYDAVADAVHWQRLERALEGAKPEIVIAEIYPLEEAAEAHRRIEAGHVLGKIVLGIR
jgi:NADPH:quinone reductase